MRGIYLLALIVGILLLLGGCAAPKCGACRVRDGRWADVTMPAHFGPIVYERVVDEGFDGNGNPYRFTAGGYGQTCQEAYCRATR